MTVVTDAYIIPPTITEKLLTGEMKRYGSVVRHAVGPMKGQIVTHLDSVDLKDANNAKSLISKGVEIVKNNKKAAIVVGGVAVASAVGGTVYHIVKNSEPRVLKHFKVAFKTYIDAIRQGELTLEKINDMDKAFKELKAYKGWKKLSLQLSTDDLNVLLESIKAYTEKLAEENNVELPSEFYNESNSIIDFQHYLEAQKKVFMAA